MTDTTRQQIIDTLATSPEVTVLVIGAGINGIGTFRDLALQGIDTLIVDRADFCSGASMASSHMVHGGVRYLENGEFRLVREAVKERNLLLKNAPHYVKPLPTTFPIFKIFSGILNAPIKFIGLLDKPSERGALVIKIGMMVYDTYTRAHQTMPFHSFANRKKSLELYPEVNPDIIYTATYYDAAMPSPERICVDLVLDAEGDLGQAHALNYVSAIGAEGDSVTLRDELTGDTFTVKPQIVVNAAGPWIDFANRALGRDTHFIGGTKGSHIILENPQLKDAIGDHEFFFENKDGRIVLIYPYADKVMIGATDVRIDDPDQARCTEDELDYFFEFAGRVFPNIKMDRTQIVFQFSGVRPLPYADANFTGQISRDHITTIQEPDADLNFPVYNLIGGKWTTFRAFAEQVTDKLVAHLGKSRTASTELLPIGGGKDYPADEAAVQAWVKQIAEEYHLSLERVTELFYRYGTRASEYVAFIAAGDDQPLASFSAFSRRELTYLVQHEHVARLDDIILRRSLLAWLGDLSVPLLNELAEITGELLGWSEEKQKEEVSRTVEIMREYHGVNL